MHANACTGTHASSTHRVTRPVTEGHTPSSGPISSIMSDRNCRALRRQSTSGQELKPPPHMSQSLSSEAVRRTNCKTACKGGGRRGKQWKSSGGGGGVNVRGGAGLTPVAAKTPPTPPQGGTNLTGGGDPALCMRVAGPHTASHGTDICLEQPHLGLVVKPPCQISAHKGHLTIQALCNMRARAHAAVIAAAAAAVTVAAARAAARTAATGDAAARAAGRAPSGATKESSRTELQAMMVRIRAAAAAAATVAHACFPEARTE